MNYLHWNEKTLTDFSEREVTTMYNQGFVFTRIGKGIMHQTRSVRIDLSKFELSSENRRILKKTEGVEISATDLPLREEYNWSLGKLAKDFYDTKFEPGIMSAQKIKELLTNKDKSNFNTLLCYRYMVSGQAGSAESPASRYTIYGITSDTDKVDPNKIGADKPTNNPTGFAISYQNTSILHYSYPFYDLKTTPKDMGLGMMIRAIQYAKDSKLKYIYLGSFQRPNDTYKLQFEGLEWFDGGPDGSEKWRTDIDSLKKT
ncbi:MAG: hypothetical protein NT077_02875 [Candidatus Taylorbacteria bacterium]|nr:hypothetical protein [Candidatus Taylorbacteria bacterium]